MRKRRVLDTTFLICGVLGLVHCGPQGAFLRIEVEGIPDGATALQVHSLLNGKEAQKESSFALNGSSSFGIGLILEQPADGKLAVAVGAQDASGCLQAVGDAQLDVRESDTTIDLSLLLSQQTPPLCATDDPTILGTEPAEISTAGQSLDGIRGLDVIGWGFHPGAQLSIGGHPQCAELLSFRRLHIAAPLLPQAPGPAHIELSLPEQTTIADDTHLRVTMARIGAAWSTPRQYAPSTELLDVASGILAPNSKPEAVILDNSGAVWRYQTQLEVLAGANGLSGDATAPLLTLSGFQSGQRGSLAVADLDGDGVDEIAVVSTVGSFIYKRMDSGNYAAIAGDASLLGQDTALVDLDRDGFRDWLIADTALRVYHNPGDGRFSRIESQSINLSTAALAVADFDGDGASDVAAVAAPPSSIVRVLYNRGGMLTDARDYVTRACASNNPPPAVVAARLDDDELPDLAINGSSALLLNRGDSFEYQYIKGAAPCFGALTIAAADLNADGAVDLAWLGTDGIAVLMNAGRGQFGANINIQELLQLPVGSGLAIAPDYHRLPLADLNGDGTADLLFGPNVLLMPPKVQKRCQ